MLSGCSSSKHVRIRNRLFAAFGGVYFVQCGTLLVGVMTSLLGIIAQYFHRLIGRLARLIRCSRALCFALLLLVTERAVNLQLMRAREKHTSRYLNSDTSCRIFPEQVNAGSGALY